MSMVYSFYVPPAYRGTTAEAMRASQTREQFSARHRGDAVGMAAGELARSERKQEVSTERVSSTGGAQASSDGTTADPTSSVLMLLSSGSTSSNQPHLGANLDTRA